MFILDNKLQYNNLEFILNQINCFIRNLTKNMISRSEMQVYKFPFSKFFRFN